MVTRDWLDPAVARPLMARIEEVSRADTEAVWAALMADLDDHRRLHDHEVVNLNPAANVPGPRVSRLLGETIGSRPSLGHPGDKYETGLVHADRVESTVIGLLTRVVGASYVEHRVGSGAMANLYAYLATCRPGDAIMALPASAGGHASHHAEGVAGLIGLRTHDIPFDAEAMNIDVPALARSASQIRPRLIVLGGSLVLTQQPVAAVRQVADEVGARVLFDGAHLSGLIVTGAYPHPLADGAHLLSASTYKSFGGPPGGFVATDDAELAERLDVIAFPGMTANFDLARTAALGAACLDLIEFGIDYAEAMVENAHALAESLLAKGVDVVNPSGEPTRTHHVAVRAGAHGGGRAASLLLESVRILVSGIGLPTDPDAGFDAGIRLGTPEVTRWGMRPDAMQRVAELMAATLGGAPVPDVARAVFELRSHYQELGYCRT